MQLDSYGELSICLSVCLHAVSRLGWQVDYENADDAAAAAQVGAGAGEEDEDEGEVADYQYVAIAGARR